jgi:transcriptional regulator with XRE-family HTH domain
MFAERLKRARERAGLTQRGLVARMGHVVTHQSIRAYEAGIAQPRYPTLVAMCDALDISTESLLIDQADLLIGLRVVVGGDRLPARSVSGIEANAHWDVERMIRLERTIGLAPSDLPGDLLLWSDGPVETIEDAERCAAALRARWNVGDAPIASCVGLLEQLGFYVAEAPLPPEAPGLLLSGKLVGAPVLGARQGVWVAMLSTLHQSSAQRRTCIATLLAELAVPPVWVDQPNRPFVVERCAEALLMPRAPLLRLVGQGRETISYQEVMTLRLIYGTSARALIMRLRAVGAISRGAVEQLTQRGSRAWLRPENESPALAAVHPHERPTQLRRLVCRAVAGQLVPTSYGAELLELSEHEMRLLAFGPGRAPKTSA